MPSAKTSGSDPDRVEVVTSVQRRHRWPLSEKLREAPALEKGNRRQYGL
jgi:hypothetical protein